MELVELVGALRLVELSAKTRPTAIRALVQATGLVDEGLSLEVLIEAIEEREATAHTIVVQGLAMPHAVVDWEGDYRVVVGRSRLGIEYGVPYGSRVHLIALFAVGSGAKKGLHLELLGALAELLSPDELRQSLVAARDVRAIEELLFTRIGLEAGGAPLPAPGVPRASVVLVQQAIGMCDAVSAQALLIAVDRAENLPWDLLSQWTGRLLVVTAATGDELRVERANTHVIAAPHASLTRVDRASLGLLLAASEGLLTDDADVVCVTGQGRRLDTLTLTKPQAQLKAMLGAKASRRAAIIPPAVILRVLSLAIEIAVEGREGHSLGTLLVVGDARQVMRHTQQLVLNPFHGYSRRLRSLLDPSLAETIKEFAQLDGAFVVGNDGLVLSAGTYLVPKAPAARLPPGLGARHQAAAAITAHTEAIAVAVSQSTGTVTVFRRGQVLLRLERATQTRS